MQTHKGIKRKNEMNKEFIPYELALELKQLGFNEPCFTYYKNDQLSDVLELVKNSEIENVNNEPDDYISAPTYSQAFRWFREKYNIHVWIINAEDNHNVFKPFFRGVNIHDQHLVDFYKTYEEAELACLKELIEIVKGGNK
jgi:hypothetical protein